jgi:hypothetical protein
MSFSYYIKNRVIDYYNYNYVDDEKRKQIQELLDNIYTCCTNGNIGKDKYHYKKIHKKHVNYPITTNIKFTDINGKYSDDKIENNLEIKKKILEIHDKKRQLDSKFLNSSYFTQINSALIAFDDNDKIYTILTYYYNTEKDCIEVHAIWSDEINNIGGGGGIMMNFLINAIKCGISLCSNPSKYKRELFLYSIDHAIGFYEKFNFVDTDGERNFTRELSVGSIDLNDEAGVLKDSDEEKNNFYKKFEESEQKFKDNENKIERLNDKLQNLNKDLQYKDSSGGSRRTRRRRRNKSNKRNKSKKNH